jgi:hypothetical protein
VQGIGNLFTLNGKDFRRFSGIMVLSPENGLAGFPQQATCLRDSKPLGPSSFRSLSPKHKG